MFFEVFKLAIFTNVSNSDVLQTNSIFFPHTGGHQDAHYSHDHIEDIKNHFSELESDPRAIQPNLHFNQNENIHNLVEDVKKRMIGIGCNKEVNSAYDEMEPKVDLKASDIIGENIAQETDARQGDVKKLLKEYMKKILESMCAHVEDDTENTCEPHAEQEYVEELSI